LILRGAVIDLPIFGNFRYGFSILLCSTFESVWWIQPLDLRCKSEVNPGLVYRNYKKKNGQNKFEIQTLTNSINNRPYSKSK
jgi:hypothetical protein